jgi:NYN domain
MDRCALFVDAGYVLADGAMAVHGTRHRESVSWNYAGLLQFLGSVARDRTGLPLLRCYWYEATVEGRRSSEHDALADLPGVKLRLGRMRPGRREGVESEIHRDLATLARNGALQDAVVVSAEEDLAQVIADVQDLGLRVTLMHITVDGNWTISRALRQECDEIVEVGEAHLRPYVELVMGAEPVRDDERHAVALHQGRALTNGHGPVGPLGHQQALPAGSPAVPPEIYTAPVIAEYQRAAQPAGNGQPGLPQPAAQDGPVEFAQPQAQPGQPQGQQPGQAQAAQARQPRQPRNPRSRRQPQAGAAAPAADIQHGAVAAPSMPPPQGMAAQQTVPAVPASQQAIPPAQQGPPAAQQTAPPQAAPAPQQAAPAAQQAMPPAPQAAPPPQHAMPPARPAAAAPQQAMPPAQHPAPPPQQAMPPAQQAAAPQQAMPPAPQAAPPPQQAMPPAQHAMPAVQPAPGPVLAAQNAGPMPMPPGVPQAGAAPGMAGQPGPQPQAQMSQPMPAPPAQPGPHHSGAISAPAGLPSAPYPGQPAPPGPMGQPAVPGQPGVQQPAAQQGQPGMAPHQAGPAGPPAGPGAQGMPAGQPVYPAPPAYQGPGPDAQAGPAGGPGPHGQAGQRQAMAGPPPSPPLASLPSPMPGQAPSGHALPPGAGGPGALPAPDGSVGPAPLPPQQAQGGARTNPAAAPAGRAARRSQDQRAAQQYPAPAADQPEGGVGPAYIPQQDPYGGLQPAGYPPVPQQTSVSLADAVQAAHGEGFNFGQSVAREAPALWLEAVLARKPRMPSDLEARLLQDSALPIDSLLHDEVRHALRRGFWDALERARH